VGSVLTVLIFIIAMLLIPIVWPLKLNSSAQAVPGLAR
jgi:hypothetical protein